MKRFILLLVVGLGVWAAFDLLGPRQVDIRVFDPAEVARLDTEMWRSYYDRKPLALFGQLAELMRRQFHFPFLRSNVAAFHAARAAFVFKDGRNRADYRQALPHLIQYYTAIHRISTQPFDVQRTSELELEWWIVHRERARVGADELERTLAEAAAELYRVPPERLEVYARERAQAMDIRDGRAILSGVRESDWQQIEADLDTSWRALSAAVRPPDR